MNDQKTALAIPVLVLGAISFVLALMGIAQAFMFMFLAMPAAIVGVILGHMALHKNTDDRRALIGLVLSYATIVVFFGSYIVGAFI